MGGAEDAWSGLARPHPVCRRLRSCEVLPLSVVCDSRRGYKRYAGVRVSPTLFLRSFVKHRISSSFLGSFTLNSNVLALSFEIHCFSAVIFFHRIIHSDWISSNFQQFSDTSFYAEKRKRFLFCYLADRDCCHLLAFEETVYSVLDR